MPKTRDAFALQKYSDTILDPFVGVDNNYSFDFKDFFSSMLVIGDEIFPPIENSVAEIEKMIKCKLDRLKGDVYQTGVDNAREVLVKVKATLDRFDRHIQRLERLKVKDVRRRALLSAQYEYASKILESFESALSEHYLILAKKIAKTFARQVGRRIRISRQLKNLSQEEVAKSIGVAAITLSTWERGTREPNLYSIAQLSRALDVPLDFLFGNSEKFPK